MAQSKPVRKPWVDQKEWNEVATKIFSANEADQKWAIDIIKLWEIRESTDNLDMFVINTGELATAIRKYKLNASQIVQEKLIVFQNEISLALLRFINSITNTEEPGIPLGEALNNVGLPPFFVTVYEEINNGTFPSLEFLIRSAELALKWLDKKYWREKKGLWEDYIPIQVEDKISKLLLIYQRMAYKVPRCKMPASNLKPILHELEKYMMNNQYKFFEKLVSPRHLLPPSYYWSRVEKQKGAAAMDPEKMITLPSIAKTTWHPLLTIINKHGLLQILAEFLLQAQTKFTPMADRLIITWVSYFLGLVYTNLEWRIPQWNWKPLLRSAVISPSKYIFVLIPALFENQDPPMSEEQKEKVMTLIAIYSGGLTDYSIRSDSDQIYTLRDLEEVDHKKQLEKDPNSNPSRWLLNDDYLPKNPLPLGTIIGNVTTEEDPVEMMASTSYEPSMDEPRQLFPRIEQPHLPLDDSDLEIEEVSPELNAQVNEYVENMLRN